MTDLAHAGHDSASAAAGSNAPDATDDVDASLQLAARVLAGARTAVVTGHVDPDGDALGSLLAITAGLREVGVQAHACWGAREVTGTPAPVPTAWAPLLPALEHVRQPVQLPAEVDVLVVCDSAAPSRLGTLQPMLDRARCTIVIDHHAVGEPFGDIRVVDEGSSSTGLLALRLLDHLEVTPTPSVANALYLAILTDTGRFSFPATGAVDHRAAARLLDAGADPAAVARAVYESASHGFLGLVGLVAERAEVRDGALVSWVLQSDLTETGARWEETDGVLALLRQVGGVDVTCLLRQTDEGRWRTSLRSRGGRDVAAVAAAFGGGGHRMAAGCTLDGSLTEARDAIASALAGRESPL